MKMTDPLQLETLPGRYAVHRLAPGAAIPSALWQASGLVSVTRTGDELSVICPEGVLPADLGSIHGGWRVMRVVGPLDFSLVGVLAQLTGVLARAGVSLFAFSTYDTDYLLVAADQLRQAQAALRRQGIWVDGRAAARAEAQEARIRIRRRDRAVYDDAWIASFLAAAEYGTLSLCDGAAPFSVIRNFVYDADRHAIYLHGARQGRTFGLVQQGSPREAVFVAGQAGRLLPAAKAADLSTEFASVTVFGCLRLEEEPVAATRALRLLAEKYFPHLRYGEDYRGVSGEDLKYTAVLCLQVDAWSGKQKRVDDDFPGAFRFVE